MKNIMLLILVSALALTLGGCGSVEKSVTTRFDTEGNVVETVVTERDASDLTTFLLSTDGNATILSADVSKFALGFSGYGLNWLSVSGVRVKAPVNDESNSAEVLEKTAGVITATKTRIQTADIGVNTDIAAKTTSGVNEQ